MTGRELIMYILRNRLENVDVFNDSYLIDINEAAAKFNVGTSTIAVWVTNGILDGLSIDNKIYIFRNAKPKITSED